MTILLGLTLVVVPVAAVIGLLWAIDRLRWRREAVVARQIRITDAIHARLGAVLAPVVRKPLGGPWQVLVKAPLERPEVVETLLAAVGDEFAAADPRHPAPFQVVLSPRDKPVSRSSRPAAAAARRRESMSWT